MVFYISHSGTPHAGAQWHSGRYHWGTGEKWEGKDPTQSRNDIIGQVARLKAQGIKSSTDIARALGMTTTEYRAKYRIAYNEQQEADHTSAYKLYEKGWSTTAIANKLGRPESTVRGWIKNGVVNKTDKATSIAKKLEATIPKDGAVDVGNGVELYLDSSAESLKTATQMLVEKGYTVQYLREKRTGQDPTKKTTVKLLCAPGVTLGGEDGLYNHRDRIQFITRKNDDTPEGETLGLRPPVSVKSSRVGIIYGDKDFEGGKGIDRDGLMFINPNAIDLRLPSGSGYAQVRIGVDGTHYLKGMAAYGNPKDFPKGVDILFNTNKKSGTPKMDVLKPMEKNLEGEIDKENPFKASYFQYDYTDPKTGKRKQSPINVIRKEGDWNDWSADLPAQFLSKQTTDLASRQLGLAYDRSRLEYDQLSHLTNPVVKKKMLNDFADQCDSAAVDLKAAAMPGQKTHVILPIPSLKDNEVFAPNYKNGTKVALIRYPHAGRFEIPILTVNNKNKEALSVITNKAIDAIGINHNTAEKLSGADFDGDFVSLIPNNNGEVKSAESLPGLKGFEPQERYALPKDIKKDDPRLMSEKYKQMAMGVVSNLITDMQIKGASTEDLERATRHSMVVIDAVKHKLDYKQSYKDNNIAQLKQKYQGQDNGRSGGAATLISRAGSPVEILERKPRSIRKGGSIDPETGEKIWENTGRTKAVPKKDKDGSIIRGEDGKPIGYDIVPVTMKVERMYLTKDARTLSSGTTMENIYASYSNHMKDLGNKSRKGVLKAGEFKVDPEAKKKYQKEVDHLMAQVKEAEMNAPLERQARVIANERTQSILKEHPEYRDDKDARVKVARKSYNHARAVIGITNKRVNINDAEWEAIQAHALSENRLNKVLKYADPDVIRKYATPKDNDKMPQWSINRAKELLNQGFTNAEVADALGISASTLLRNVKDA